jgi:hypothetical protein
MTKVLLSILFIAGCTGNDAEIIRLREVHFQDSLNISALRITVDTVENQLGTLQGKYNSLYKETEPLLPYEGQVIEYRGQIMTWDQGEWLLGCVHPGCALKAHKEATERTTVQSVNQSGGVTAGTIINNQP